VTEKSSLRNCNTAELNSTQALWMKVCRVSSMAITEGKILTCHGLETEEILEPVQHAGIVNLAEEGRLRAFHKKLFQRVGAGGGG